MRGKLLTWGLIVVGVALLLIQIFFPFQVGYSWLPHYKHQSLDPYGVRFVYELLKDGAVDFTELEDSLVFDDGDSASVLFFIGRYMNDDSMDMSRLLDFVESGNVAFIASEELPLQLLFQKCLRLQGGEWPSTTTDEKWHEVQETFWTEYSHDFYRDSAIRLHLLEGDTARPFFFQYRNEKHIRDYPWSYLNFDLLCACPGECSEEEVRQFVLGEMEFYTYDYEAYETPYDPFFVYVPFGSGRIYIHSVPLTFTNYALKDEAGFAYVSSVFKYLPKGKIYWDSRPMMTLNVQSLRARRTVDNTPLKYVLSQPTLAYAWYLMLFSALLYVLFRGKRRQRVVPVLVQPENTSMEYVALIGQLAFLKGDHRKLGLEMLRLWAGYIHRHYGISLHEASSDVVVLLAARTGVSQNLIERIFMLKKNIESSSFFSEQTLLSLHRLLEEFYRKDRKSGA